MVNESDQAILATTYLDLVRPFLEVDETSMDTSDETAKLMRERVKKVEDSLKQPKIKAIYERASLANPDDKYLIDTIAIVRALGRGDRVEAGQLWLKLLGLEGD